MRKIYLSLTAALIGTASFAQHSVVKQNFAANSFNGGKIENIKQNSAIGIQRSGTVVWSDDFTTATNWTIDNDGQTDATHGWNINSTSQAWFSSFQGGMTSTSGGNYAEVQNGNYNQNNQALGVTYVMTTAAAIDVQTLAGTSQVSLQFEQWGSLFNDAQTVEVSTDGLLWTEVYTNADKDAFVGNNPSAIYPNPELITVNIAGAISGNPSSVWVRFVWTSRNPSATNNPADLGWWTTFGWYIDDVAIVTNPDNDLTIDEFQFGQGNFFFPYYIIAQSQVSDISFSALVTNNGAVDQTGSFLTVDANGTSLTSATSTISVGNQDSLFTTLTYAPGTTLGAQTFSYSVASDFTDDNPGDNSGSTSVTISDFVFARDKAGANGTATTGSVTNWSGAAGDPFKIGNIFEVQADVTMYAVDVKFSGTVPTGGALVFAEVYRFNSGSNSYEFVETTYELDIQTAAQVNAMQTMFLTNPVALTAGDDILVVAGHYGSDMGIAYSGAAVDNSVVGFDAAGSLVGLADPVNMCVRMNFDEDAWIASGIQSNGSEFGTVTNYPNPFNGTTTVSFSLANTQTVILNITDMTGKVIEVMNLGSLTAGNHVTEINGSNLASGVYYYTLTAGNNSVTKKMIIK